MYYHNTILITTQRRKLLKIGDVLGCNSESSLDFDLRLRAPKTSLSDLIFEFE